jgi:hypothetical protein
MRFGQVISKEQHVPSMGFLMHYIVKFYSLKCSKKNMEFYAVVMPAFFHDN